MSKSFCSELVWAREAARRGVDRMLAVAPLLLFVFISLPSVPTAHAQQTPAPATETLPVAPLQPASAKPSAPRAARPPKGATAATAVVAPPAKPPAPRQVITVIHRLSGWKLLSLLSAKRALHVVGVDALPSNSSDVHTNIVAGYVVSDGRTIIACLPQAEVEAEESLIPPDLFEGVPKPPVEDSGLIVVRGDGAEFKARFVGLDSTTGLSLLEASEPILPAAPNASATLAPALVEGQRVRLYAPEPVPHAAPTPPSAPVASDMAVGEAGVIYTGMSVVEGEVSQIRRAPSGRPLQATVTARPQLSPEWTGAVAFDRAGVLVGILAGNYEQGETRLIPAEAMRGAEARVLARRASVPRPWLGVRGDAVAATSLDKLLSQGWPRAQALSLLNKRLGVMLTSVAQGTPAAKAGLRPGDVVSRISRREVLGLEDFSFFLKEAGAGSTLNFTILRARQPNPLDMSVRLSGALNPAGATESAELRAAEFYAKQEEARARADEARARGEESRARNSVARARLAETQALSSGDAKRVEDTRKQLDEMMERVRVAEKKVAEAATRVREAARLSAIARERVAAAERTRDGILTRASLLEGLNAVAVSPKVAADFNARGGLLVLSVAPQSQAERFGLRPRDVIETLNGELIADPEKVFKLDLDAEDSVLLGVVRAGQKITLPRIKP